MLDRFEGFTHTIYLSAYRELTQEDTHTYIDTK